MVALPVLPVARVAFRIDVRELASRADTQSEALDALLDHVRPADEFDAFDLALVLMQQRNRSDQRQVLHVITPGPGLIVDKGQLFGKGVGD